MQFYILKKEDKPQLAMNTANNEAISYDILDPSINIKASIDAILKFAENNNINLEKIKDIGLTKGSDNKFYNKLNLPDGFTCEELDLSNMNLTNCRFPKNLKCKYLDMSHSSLKGNFDFSQCHEVNLAFMNLENVNSIKAPIDGISFLASYNLPKKIDLGSVSSYINLSDTSFSNVEEFILPPKESKCQTPRLWFNKKIKRLTMEEYNKRLQNRKNQNLNPRSNNLRKRLKQEKYEEKLAPPKNLSDVDLSKLKYTGR
ncbi:MAG: hypothetical protein R3Y43_03565 [Alphaproteobacteria bacterium]